MAKKEDTKAASGGSSIVKKVLIWGLTAVILLGGSAGAALYMSGSLGRLTLVRNDSSASGTEPVVDNAPALYLSLDPPFVVNFEDQGLQRYLQVSVSVMARDETIIEAVRNHSPYIKNNLIMLFSSQDYAALGTTEGKEQLRALALDDIQSVLRQETGNSGVEAVYFTSFIIQ